MRRNELLYMYVGLDKSGEISVVYSSCDFCHSTVIMSSQTYRLIVNQIACFARLIRQLNYLVSLFLPLTLPCVISEGGPASKSPDPAAYSTERMLCPSEQSASWPPHCADGGDRCHFAFCTWAVLWSHVAQPDGDGDGDDVTVTV